MSTYQGLFYAYRLENCVHFTFMGPQQALYNRERWQQSYINYNLLLYYFITQNERRVEQKRVKDVWAARNGPRGMDLWWTSSLLDQNLPGYITCQHEHN